MDSVPLSGEEELLDSDVDVMDSLAGTCAGPLGVISSLDGASATDELEELDDDGATSSMTSMPFEPLDALLAGDSGTDWIVSPGAAATGLAGGGTGAGGAG